MEPYALGDSVGVGVEPAEEDEDDRQRRRKGQSHLLILCTKDQGSDTTVIVSTLCHHRHAIGSL